MKNFKYLYSYISILAIALVFASCEDEDKARVPELTNGGYVKFVSQPVFEAGGDPTSASFNAVTEDPNGNVTNYELSVRGFFEGAPEDTLAWKSTTTFPFDVSFSGDDMASFFGLADASAFESGDSFEFFATVTIEDGTVYSYIAPACECPTADDEPDPTGGTWNGGNTNTVLLNAAGLLQALNYEVEFSDPN